MPRVRRWNPSAKDEPWPKPCPGGCGHNTRPMRSTAKQFPGTRPAVNTLGWCDACRRRVNGRPARSEVRVNEPRAYVKDPVVRERRERELLEWRVNFEADRRRRGVPPEGILFDDEKPTESLFDLQEQRRKPRPVEGHEHAKPSNKCKNGHEYDAIDNGGRRRCTTCMSAAGKKASHPVRQKPDYVNMEAPLGRCKRGHAYQLSAGGKRLCRPCANDAKRRWRKARAEQGLPTHYNSREVRDYEASRVFETVSA